MKKKKKNNQNTIFTSVWIAFVSLFLLSVLDLSFQKMGSETFIKNSPYEKVLKSESRSKVRYKVEDGNGNYKYSWTFNKKDDENYEDEINFDIETDVINSKIEKLTDTADKLVLTFAHHGELPSDSEIQIDVSDKYDDGESLYLYYYNEDENQIEYERKGIVVNEGKADFKISHCSEYILSKDIIENSVNNPSGVKVYLFYIMIGMIITFTLKTVLFKGK